MRRLLTGGLLLLLALGIGLLLLPSCKKDGQGTSESTASGSASGTAANTGAPEADTEVPWLVNGNCNYTVIRSRRHKSDCVEKAVTTIQKELKSLLDANVAVMYDDQTYDAEAYQIYVGYTQYPETTQAIGVLRGMGDYGVLLIGNKIVITGHSQKTLNEAVSDFTSVIRKVTKASAESGNVVLKQSDFERGHTNSYYADWPAFIGYMKGETALAYGAYQSIYSNATDAMFDSYCQALGESGFSCYQTNEIGTNKYATYVKETGSVYVSYAGSTKCVSVVASKLNSGYGIGRVTPETYDPSEKVTDTTFVMYALRYNHRDITDGNGMCLVTILEDGSYVIFDSGYNVEAERLFRFLRDNNKRSDGIHIKAWFLTHFHRDHTEGFTEFSKEYGEQVTLEYVIANPATRSSYLTTSTDAANDKWSLQLPGEVARFGGSPLLVIPRAGEKYSFCGTEFEILYTHEDIFPFTVSSTVKMDDGNEGSTVLRMTAYGKTVLITGDAAGLAIDVLNVRYGKLLHSDIFQVCHHGHWGMTETFFNYVNPTYAVYPTNMKTLLLRQEGWKYAPNAYVTKKLGWDHIFTCDDKCKLLPMNYRSLEEDMTYYTFTD